MLNAFTPHHHVCECGLVFEDFHGHGLCFGCKIQTLRFDTVSHASDGMAENDIVAANAASGRKIVRASDSDSDKRDFKKPIKATLSDDTKRLIHQTHGR